MFYRLYQFFSALFPHITVKEIDYAKSLLTDKELKIFNKLQASDQKHALRIAFYLRELYPDDMLLQRAGLLHDIGKILRPLSPIEKILTVILDKSLPALAKKLSQKEDSIMDFYYNHAEKGAKLAEKLELDKDIIFLLRNHHNENIQDAKLKALIEADNLY